jgi:hypothetical protein
MDQLRVLLFSGDDEGLYLIVAVMVGYSSTTGYIFFVLYYLYVYQLCIVMFINTSNIYLQIVYPKKSPNATRWKT